MKETGIEPEKRRECTVLGPMTQVHLPMGQPQRVNLTRTESQNGNILLGKNIGKKNDMKLEDLKLTIIKTEGIYVAWMDSFKGLIIQADSLDEIAGEIATSLKVMLMYGFDKGIHEIIDSNDILNKNHENI
jgi:hypothetical protein